MQTIDCRGQACPAPVIATKKALENGSEAVAVLLDDGAPRENVTRFARNRGFHVVESRSDNGWLVTISATATDSCVPPAAPPQPLCGERVLLITSDRLGNGADDLGHLLMRTFLHTLLETAARPERILLLNSGVMLAATGAETEEALQTLAQLGVQIASCGVCLDYYGIKDQLAVGTVTNMFSIAEQLQQAGSVIRL